MRWLVHGNLTPAVKEALQRHGHTAEAVTEVAAQPDVGYEDLLDLVRRSQKDLMTDDRALVQNLLDKPSKIDRSVVHLQLAGGDIEQDAAVDRLFTRYKRLKPGMLYTVTESRVKIRHCPARSFFERLAALCPCSSPAPSASTP